MVLKYPIKNEETAKKFFLSERFEKVQAKNASCFDYAKRTFWAIIQIVSFKATIHQRQDNL